MSDPHAGQSAGRAVGDVGRTGVAMLGAGAIAEYHLAGLAAAGGADVRVIAGRSLDKTRALATRFGIAETTDDVAAAIGRSDVAAVVVATPDDTHEAIAIAAARAGKAALVQKPLAGSVASAERIVAEAARCGVDLQVSFMHRFFDEVIEARRWLGEGRLGRVLAARIRNATPGPDWGAWFYRRDRVPNGVVDQLGVHGIDLVQHLLGRVVTVNARARTARPRRRLADGHEVDVEIVDNATALYTLHDGTLVTHEMSLTEVAGCDRFCMDIHGERGTLLLRGPRGRFAAFVPERYGCEWHVPTLTETTLGARQHAAWLAGVTEATARLSTAREAVDGMRVVEAVMRSSAEDGAPVQVRER